MSQQRILPTFGIAFALGLASLGLTAKAEAADYNPQGVLRGPYSGDAEPRSAGVDWAGFYGGVHVGYTHVKSDASGLRGPLVAGVTPAAIQPAVSLMSAFRSTQKSGLSYGGFVGMNWQWDDVVLGVEADYTYANLRTGEVINGSGTQNSGVLTYTINSTSNSRQRVREWATIRGRVGWANGMFMPYLTAGIAVGHVTGRPNLSGSWTLNGVPPTAGTFTASSGSTGLTFGGVIGGGVDMQIVPNAFLRAEWQSILFTSGSGGNGPRPEQAIHIGRIGGGMKF